jgi:hypothetical protein
LTSQLEKCYLLDSKEIDNEHMPKEYDIMMLSWSKQRMFPSDMTDVTKTEKHTLHVCKGQPNTSMPSKEIHNTHAQIAPTTRMQGT